MAKKFTVDASKKKIQASYFSRAIRAAKDEPVDPRLEQADLLHDRVEDDFDYVLTGIERLGREGMIDEALELLNTIAGTLDSAISIIGNNFEENNAIDSYTDFGDMDQI